MASRAAKYQAAEALRVGFRLHLRGEYAAANEIYGHAELGGASDAELAMFYAAAASTSWAQDDIDNCRARTALARVHAERSGEDEALGWAWVAQALLAALDGDPHAEGQAFSRAFRHASRAGDTLTRVRVLINVGFRLTSTGHHDRAVGQLERAFSLLAELDDPMIDAMARYDLGLALLRLGRCDEALALFDQARRRWLEADAPQLRMALHGIGDTHAALGNASLAASAYRDAIRRSEGGAAPQTMVLALAGLARVTVIDDPEECDRALDRALDHPARVAPVDVYLAAGWVALARGMRHVAIAHGREAEREAGRRQDSAGMADALELLSLSVNPDRPDGRLAEARMLWIESQDAVRSIVSEIILARKSGDIGGERVARARLRSLGVRDDTDRIAGPLLVLGTAPHAGVEVHTLGTFSVTRDGRRVLAAEWRTPSSRAVLQVLASCLGRGISRAELIRRAWPEGDVAVDGLTEAIEDLRTVLDPMRTHPRDELVQVDADVVSLDPQTVIVDAATFHSSARFALASAAQGSARAAELLEAAVALYTGRFLDGVDDLDWVIDTREELAGLFRNVLRALADQRAAEPERAVPWLVGLLQEDPYDGAAHLDLVRTLGAAGRSSEAIRYYAEYATRMREVGGTVEPMPSA